MANGAPLPYGEGSGVIEEDFKMNLLKTTAAALSLLSLTACGGFMSTAVPVSDRSTYVSPRASLDAPVSQPGLGAGGGGGGGAGAPRR
jgi:hypothetical protein